MLQREACTMGKTFPLCVLYICTYAHAVISVHVHESFNQWKKNESLRWFTVREWYKGLKWDQIVFREPTLGADGSVFHLLSHEISFSVLCSAISLFSTIWVCFYKATTESSSTKQIVNNNKWLSRGPFPTPYKIYTSPLVSYLHSYTHPWSRYPASILAALPNPHPLCLKPDENRPLQVF